MTNEHDSVAVLYADRDHEQLGEHYARHVAAMTAEGLHAKSDIAAELAWRDAEIERLTREAAPQASGGDGLPWQTISDAQLLVYIESRSGLEKTLAQALLDTRRFAIRHTTGDGALRSEIQWRFDEMIAAQYDKSERVNAIMETLRSLLDWSHPQAAGSAPVGVDAQSPLLRHGRHDAACAYCHDSAYKPRPVCTCGFDAALAVPVGVAKRSTSQSVAFQYLDQVVERQTAAFYSAFGIGTADKIESNAALEKGRAE